LERIGEHALTLLEDRFPGVKEAARAIEEPPSLSRRAGDALYGLGRVTARSRPAAPRRAPGSASRRPLNRVAQHALAHPLLALAVTVVSIVVIVHFLTYIVLGAIALTALRARGARN
jgi:hypothetical protein